MAGAARKATKTQGYKSEVRALREEFNKLLADVERMRAYLRRPEDHVANVEFVATAGAGLAAHGTNVYNILTARAVVCSYRGNLFTQVADAEAAVATILGTGKTIAASKFGALWVYGTRTANLGLKVPADAQSEATDIAALAQAMPAPAAGQVPIGAAVVEADASEWEWGHATNGRLGTDSTSVAYYSLIDTPHILSAMASFALDTDAATFTYGAASAILGDGTALTISGKANVAFPAGEQTAIASNKVGAFVLYALADDDEIPVQIGAAYASLQAAKTAVDDLIPNPLLVELGRIYIENWSGTAFTPGTTKLDATGITVTFETMPARGQLLGATDLTAATVNA